MNEPHEHPLSFAAAVAYLAAGYLGAAFLCNSLPEIFRPTSLLTATAVLSMAAVAWSGTPFKRRVSVVCVATALSLLAIYIWRHSLDSTAALGPVPAPLEWIGLVILGCTNVLLATIVAMVCVSRRCSSRRWIVVGSIALLLVGIGIVIPVRVSRAKSLQGLLQQVVALEQSTDGTNWGQQQSLSTILAFLGRQHELRELPLGPDAVGQRLLEPPLQPESEPQFIAVHWREGTARIAAEQQLVLIMEDHTISEHCAWIEQTLGIFRQAGYTRYCAETIAESGAELKERGYPTTLTGFYTLDPRLGNLLRTAIRLDFEIDGYDLSDPSFERREESQAATLARLFTQETGTKMLVHGGHAHVIKHEVRGTGRYIGARLWEKTGTEPFTIWQWSNKLGNEDYRRIIAQLGPISEPVMLLPPPPDLQDRFFRLSSVQPAVDAIVIHPPRIGRAPTDRRPVFSSHMTRVVGEWSGGYWPVVVAAFGLEEPDHAISHDQVLLRTGETKFELWVPTNNYEIRVADLNGRVTTDVESMPHGLRISLRGRPAGAR